MQLDAVHSNFAFTLGQPSENLSASDAAITQGDQLNRLKMLRYHRDVHCDQSSLGHSRGSSNRAISGPAYSHKQTSTNARDLTDRFTPSYDNLPDTDSETGVCTRSQALRQSSPSALVAVGRPLRTIQRVRNSTGLAAKPLLPPRPKDLGGRGQLDPTHTITVHIGNSDSAKRSHKRSYSMRLNSHAKPNGRAVPVPETTSVGVGPGVRSPNHDTAATEFSTFYINPVTNHMGSSGVHSCINPVVPQSGKSTPCPAIPSNTNTISGASSEKGELTASNHHLHLGSRTNPKRGPRHKAFQPQSTLMDPNSASPTRPSQTTKTWHVGGRYLNGVHQDLVHAPRSTSSASGASFTSSIPSTSTLFSGMFSREPYYTRSTRAGSLQNSISDLSSYLLGFPNSAGLGSGFVPPWTGTNTNKVPVMDDGSLLSRTRPSTPTLLYHSSSFRGLNGYLTMPRGKPNILRSSYAFH
ncbi:hypothetical protein D915_005485 [Fasciola hepatica]|uniref:Uncharacterized protein n=1 Tax=Fasciola hepatica TaxID=6192 RepID=A0A4E0R5T5_FASHE|nr:hypothetical protein D915_005485 [Fasciola hepatica]